jgi:hypothetical protein
VPGAPCRSGNWISGAIWVPSDSIPIRSRRAPMKGTHVLTTAVVALVVVIAYDSYKSKR